MSSYSVTYTVTPVLQKYAEDITQIAGSAAVTFSPTSAISSVSMRLALSSVDNTFISILSADRSFPATMTSAANTINFNITCQNATLSGLGIYTGTYNKNFLVSALGTSPALFGAASADTVTSSQSASYVALSDVYTQTILWPSDQEHARLYVEGAF